MATYLKPLLNRDPVQWVLYSLELIGRGSNAYAFVRSLSPEHVRRITYDAEGRDTSR